MLGPGRCSVRAERTPPPMRIVQRQMRPVTGYAHPPVWSAPGCWVQRGREGFARSRVIQGPSDVIPPCCSAAPIVTICSMPPVPVRGVLVSTSRTALSGVVWRSQALHCVQRHRHQPVHRCRREIVPSEQPVIAIPPAERNAQSAVLPNILNYQMPSLETKCSIRSASSTRLALYRCVVALKCWLAIPPPPASSARRGACVLADGPGRRRSHDRHRPPAKPTPSSAPAARNWPVPAPVRWSGCRC